MIKQSAEKSFVYSNHNIIIILQNNMQWNKIVCYLDNRFSNIL